MVLVETSLESPLPCRPAESKLGRPRGKTEADETNRPRHNAPNCNRNMATQQDFPSTVLHTSPFTCISICIKPLEQGVPCQDGDVGTFGSLNDALLAGGKQMSDELPLYRSVCAAIPRRACQPFATPVSLYYYLLKNPNRINNDTPILP